MTRAHVSFEHARLGRKIIVLDATQGRGYGVCAWDTCDRDASSLYQVRQHEHAVSKSDRNCEAVDLAGGALGRHVWFAFCSGRHKDYWVNATGGNAHESLARTGRAYGNLPVGRRGRDQL